MNNRLKFKQICTLCASRDGNDLGICAPCLDDLSWHNTPQCPQCALPTDGSICGHCLNSPPNFNVTRAVFTYDYPIDTLLQHYKYNEALYLANTFATLLCQKVATNHTKIDRIIPMPMHPARLKERSFNQALEVARLVSKQLHIPLDYTSCQRTRYTPPQAGLPLKERVKNIKGVFACHTNMQGLNIAMIDDVMTTGASLNELAKTLKQAGAAHVECWVMARTLPR